MKNTQNSYVNNNICLLILFLLLPYTLLSMVFSIQKHFNVFLRLYIIFFYFIFGNLFNFCSFLLVFVNVWRLLFYFIYYFFRFLSTRFSSFSCDEDDKHFILFFFSGCLVLVLNNKYNIKIFVQHFIRFFHIFYFINKMHWPDKWTCCIRKYKKKLKKT